MKAAIQRAYTLDTPRESEGGAGQDAWNVEGSARFANRLPWSALVDIVALQKADSSGLAVSGEARELANDARTWIAGAEDCRVTFEVCVELLFSSDIPELADKLREAIEADPSRVLQLVEQAMREAEHESAMYPTMQRGPAGETPSEENDEAELTEDVSPQREHGLAWLPPAAHRASTDTVTTALMVEVPPLPVQSAISLGVLAGGQYLLPLFDDQDDMDQFASAYDARSTRAQRARGM